MTMRIRSETITDYHRIAEINALAFAPYLKEPLASSYVSEFALVDLLRHGAAFDPDLSLVAEVDGAVVGHALFYPHRVLVGGITMRAVSLGPIAVDPAFQRRGIGSQLILEGHRRARGKGCAYSYLLGHPSYYPRFGYLQDMFGDCCIEVRADDSWAAPDRLAERPVTGHDLEWLGHMWLDWFEDVDLAVLPGDSILDWLPHADQIMAVVIEKDGEPIGYVRYLRHDPAQVKLFLANDSRAIRPMLARLFAKLKRDENEKVRLPLHPESEAVKMRFGLPFKPKLQTSKAAMIKILDEDNAAIEEYCEQVLAGRRKPGLVLWPPSFELG
jgi:predicted N-acetyltransferase YhbS